MGTRARIAIKHETEEKYASIYTHWDGYPEHHGAILLKHYKDRAKVEQLMALGDLSSLGAEIGTKHDFNSRGTEDVCTAYGRDRGETDTEAVESSSLEELAKLTQDCGGEYLYLFKDGTWFVAEGGIAFFGLPADKQPNVAGLRPVAEVLAEKKKVKAS